MTLLESPFISTLLGLAATFLTLAVLVQILQEFYKYLTSSKSRAYVIALRDFLGPWAKELLRPTAYPNLSVRGPFQLTRIRPRGRLLPMSKDELVAAMERTAPPWVQRVLGSLEVEVEMQSGSPGSPSASWTRLLGQVGDVERGASGFLKATEIAEFLRVWGHAWNPPGLPSVGRARKRRSRTDVTPSPLVRVGTISPPARFDASQLLIAFRRQFLPHVDAAAERFPLLDENFDFAYQRRNIRQTFLFALLLAVACNLPFEKLYMKASGLSLEQASNLTEQALALQERVNRDSLPSADKETIDRLLAAGRSGLAAVDAGTTDMGRVKYLIDGAFLLDLWNGGYRAIIRYLFGCLVTALLVSFGAPMWNDIASALLRMQKEQRRMKGVNTNG